MFLVPSVYAFVINMATEVLAEDGGQSVLGPEISGLDINAYPNLGFLPFGTIVSFWYLCGFLATERSMRAVHYYK